MCALPADGCRVITEKCRSAFAFKKFLQFDGDERAFVYNMHGRWNNIKFTFTSYRRWNFGILPPEENIT